MAPITVFWDIFRRMRKALGGLPEEVERKVGSSYEATVWRKLEDGTRKAYSDALYRSSGRVESTDTSYRARP